MSQAYKKLRYSPKSNHDLKSDSNMELTPLAIANLAAEEREKGANEWKALNKQLWAESVEQMKVELRKELEQKWNARKKELAEEIYREFAELMAHNGQEIEVYVRNSTKERQEIFDF